MLIANEYLKKNIVFLHLVLRKLSIENQALTKQNQEIRIRNVLIAEKMKDVKERDHRP